MSNEPRTAVLLAFVALSVASGVSAQRVVRRDLLVAAAASLSGVAPALTVAFHDVKGIDLRFNFAGSNTLARQIVEGARVDVFISADPAQMDVVERADRLVPDSRVDIIGNQLVVIVPEAGAPSVTGPDDLARPAVRRLAMGDPEAVPVGVYGRQWLESVRLWSDVQPKVVPLPSSPAVVAAVREGRAQAGIVYATDARDTPNTSGVRVAHVVAIEDAPQILYPAAAIRGRRVPDARVFLDFLRSATARRIFEAAGFRPPSLGGKSKPNGRD